NGTGYNFSEVPLAAATNGAGPSLAAALADDTGASATDGVTSDPTIPGTVHANGTLASLTATLDNSSARINLLGQVDGNGQFLLNTAQIDQAAGGRWGDGAHSITITASDSAGRSSTGTVHFTLDRTAPSAPTMDFGGTERLGNLNANADVHVAKENSSSNYTITGTATAGSTVELLGVGAALTTTADSAGAFSFSNVHLTSIVNELTAVVLD